MHTYTHRNGSSRLPFESLADYEKALKEDIGQAQALMHTELGITPRAFAYPFGAIGDGELDILRKMGFSITFTCTERANPLSPSAESLLDLGRFRRRNHMSAEAFFTHVVKLP
jgi:peptidoglycan/xylan/chitin deacetylase (PgdA/CDA1 family)